MRNQFSWFDKYRQFENTAHSDWSRWKMTTLKKVCQWCQLMLMLMLLKVEEARRKLQDVPSCSLSSLDRCRSSSNARWLKSILLTSIRTCFSIGTTCFFSYICMCMCRGSLSAVSPFPSSSSPSSSPPPAAMGSKCDLPHPHSLEPLKHDLIKISVCGRTSLLVTDRRPLQPWLERLKRPAHCWF